MNFRSWYLQCVWRYTSEIPSSLRAAKFGFLAKNCCGGSALLDIFPIFQCQISTSLIEGTLQCSRFVELVVMSFLD